MSHEKIPHTAQQQKLYLVARILIALLLLPYLSARARGVEQQPSQMSPDALYSVSSRPAIQDDKEIRRLESGKPIERELVGAQAHSYELTLAKADYLHLVVDQRGIDVVVLLFAPDGEKLVEVDSPNGMQGIEPVMVVVEAAGSYRLEVRAPDKDAAMGRYELKVKEIRPATEQDRMRITARQAFTEAELLREERTADAAKRAIEKCEMALTMFRAISDRDGEIMTLRLIAGVYLYLRDERKAHDYDNQILTLYQAAGDRDGEAHTLNDIGFFYKSLGEFQMALYYFRRALPIFQDIGNRSKEARTLRIIGEVYFATNERKKAIDYFNRALAIFRSLGDKAREAWTLYDLGFTYRTSGEKQPALEYLNQALSLYQALEDRFGEGNTLIEIAYAHLISDDNEKALALFARVREIFKAIKDTEGEAYVLYGIGLVYRDMAEHQKALAYFNQSLSVWQAAGNRSGEFMTVYQIARVERARGNLLAALSHIEAVLKHIETQRGQINNQNLRASYFAGQRELYEFNINLLMQLHQERPSEGYDASALQGSERARARSLLELLTEAHANIRQDVDAALLERERELQQMLISKAERLMQLRSKASSVEHGEAVRKESVTVEREIEALTTEYQQIESQIRLQSPRSAALTQPQPLSLKEIQKLLDPHTLLLEYSLGEEKSYLWAVTPTTLESFELPKRAEVEAAAKRVYQLLTARSQRPEGETSEARQARIEQADAEYLQAAVALSRMLLKDVSAQLRDKRLVIVSDGALQYIPFAALPKPANIDNRSAVAHSPLLVNHEIVNLPSASTLAILRLDISRRRIAVKAVAILADPVFDKDDVRLKATAPTRKPTTQSSGLSANTVTRDIERAMEDLDGNFQFPPLRLTAAHWEAEEISKLVPPRERMLALDFSANRRTATSPELSQYRIVHFATHAFINSERPELSGIVLSLVNERGERQDGFLPVNEIFNLKLPVELVVLSACQTGLGREVKGEGMIGMTRGFMYAGTPRMVVSLWSVDDRATSALMVRFYKRMLRGRKQTPAAALHAAQIEMWKETGWKAPYFWAGFIFQGEWKYWGAN